MHVMMSMCKNGRELGCLQLEAQFSVAFCSSKISSKPVVHVPESRIIQDCKSAGLQCTEHWTQQKGVVGREPS